MTRTQSILTRIGLFTVTATVWLAVLATTSADIAMRRMLSVIYRDASSAPSGAEFALIALLAFGTVVMVGLLAMALINLRRELDRDGEP